MQRFGRGGFVSAAIRSGVPIVPCSIVGAEEIYPIIGNVKILARLFGFPYVPVTPTFPLLGPLGLLPLPSKWIIEFGEPIETDKIGAAGADDPMLVFNLTDQVREVIQQSLYKLLLARRTQGVIKFELFEDLAPVTAQNFIDLTERGFYDGLKFHRYVEGFVIQGGDPEGTGRGGPDYRFADEPVRGEYTEGAVAMANAGPDSNGSQFFICIDDCRRKLAKSYNLFGYVIDGLEVAQSVAVGDVMRSVGVTERALD